MNIEDIRYFNDVYDKQVQDTLLMYADRGKISEVVTAIIDIHNDRHEMMVGMYNRTRLDSASGFNWKDVRKADGVPIFARQSPGATKVNHRLHTPFDKSIINSKASYFVGIPPEYAVADDDEVRLTLTDEMTAIGFDWKVSELAQRASGRGDAYALLSSPPGDKNIYMTLPFEWSCVILYDPVSGEPKYGLRYWTEIYPGEDTRDGDTEGRKIYAEWYTDTEKIMFTGNNDGMMPYEKPVLHLMGAVPLVEFPNNTERLGEVELTLSLQDAFDIADSDLSSEVSQLRLAYLLISDDSVTVDDAWLKSLQQTGVLALENGDAKFIDKVLNVEAVEGLKADLESRIYRYSNSYNPDELGSDKALTAFQIQQKLFKLESAAKETEVLFRASIARVIDIVANFKGISIDPDKIDITFTRNMPRNVIQDIKDLAESGYRMSQKRMAALAPLDIDQDINEEELAEEASFIALDTPDEFTAEAIE